MTIYKPKEVKAAAMFPKFVTTKAMFRLKKIYYKIRSRAEYMSSLTGPVTGPWRAICRDAEDISLWRKATLSFHDWKLNVLGVRSYVGAGLENGNTGMSPFTNLELPSAIPNMYGYT